MTSIIYRKTYLSVLKKLKLWTVLRSIRNDEVSSMRDFQINSSIRNLSLFSFTFIHTLCDKFDWSTLKLTL